MYRYRLILTGTITKLRTALESLHRYKSSDFHPHDEIIKSRMPCLSQIHSRPQSNLEVDTSHVLHCRDTIRPTNSLNIQGSEMCDWSKSCGCRFPTNNLQRNTICVGAQIAYKGRLTKPRCPTPALGETFRYFSV
jgi:hypothetical protein